MDPTTDNSAQNVLPPAPTLAEPQSTDPIIQLVNYKRMSTLLFLFLCIITLNLAQYAWFYITAKRVREIWPRSPISPMAFIWTATAELALLVAVIVFKLSDEVTRIINLPIGIALLYYMFMLRNFINVVLGNDRSAKYWMGGLGTFFFGAIYMNYKLNRAIDTAKTIERSLPS